MNTLHDRINKFKNLINEDMESIYNNGPKSLVLPINYVLKGRGKRLRPILTLIICDMNNIPIKISIGSALSIELLHNFTLIHDDIMDKDIIRHGIETIHKKWDENTAILAGDAMLAISLKMLFKNSHKNNDLIMRTFINGLLSVCEGQALDIEFENRKSINIDEYKDMIYLKTAYMMGLSAQIGGMISNLSEEENDLLKKLGESIGMAFQVQDDILELFSNSKKMNKSLDSDLILQKKTFLWACVKNNDKEELSSIIKSFKSDKLKCIQNLRDFVIRVKIKDKADEFIQENINIANNMISMIEGDKALLNYYTNLILRREK